MDYRPEVDISAIEAARAGLRNPQKLWLLAANYDFVDGAPVPRAGKWLREVLRYAQDNLAGTAVGIYLLGQLSEEQLASLASDNTKIPSAPKWSTSIQNHDARHSGI